VAAFTLVRADRFPAASSASTPSAYVVPQIRQENVCVRVEAFVEPADAPLRYVA
jgi:hypothetical protein